MRKEEGRRGQQQDEDEQQHAGAALVELWSWCGAARAWRARPAARERPRFHPAALRRGSRLGRGARGAVYAVEVPREVPDVAGACAGRPAARRRPSVDGAGPGEAKAGAGAGGGDSDERTAGDGGLGGPGPRSCSRKQHQEGEGDELLALKVVALPPPGRARGLDAQLAARLVARHAASEWRALVAARGGGCGCNERGDCARCVVALRAVYAAPRALGLLLERGAGDLSSALRVSGKA